MKMKLMGTLFFAAACLFAQGERGSVTGIVTDSSGTRRDRHRN